MTTGDRPEDCPYPACRAEAERIRDIGRAVLRGEPPRQPEARRPRPLPKDDELAWHERF